MARLAGGRPFLSEDARIAEIAGANRRARAQLSLDRSYLRFSLRTGFVALTAGSIWLGFTVEQARKQRDATAKIRAFGGGVSYDWERRWLESHPVSFNYWKSEDWRPPGPACLRKLIGDDFFQRVEGVRFLGRVDERAFAVCLEFPDLKEVDLCGVTASSGGPLPRPHPNVRHPNVTNEHLTLLTRLKRLEAIGFSGTAISDAGLKRLTALNRLRYLDISDTNVTDDGLRSLKDIRSLGQLCIGHTNVLDQFAAELKQALPDCEIVW